MGFWTTVRGEILTGFIILGLFYLMFIILQFGMTGRLPNWMKGKDNER